MKKYALLTGANDAPKKLLALQSSKEGVNDFLQTFLRCHEAMDWDGLKFALRARFGSITDSEQTMAVRRYSVSGSSSWQRTISLRMTGESNNRKATS